MKLVGEVGDRMQVLDGKLGESKKAVAYTRIKKRKETSPYFKQLTNLNEVNRTQILTIQIKSKLTFETFLSLTNKIKYVVRRRSERFKR
ncbi:hypothetical protein NQ317_019432 [Molorchus minor]|uniref:Uncharacterized protein n=1 Tax=Molorchus minor TaxID=1323400 RepID=A0ABQ9K094_9CUCU|nr:hypothetical protein NQ317_019432 [Molorchus minor]